MSNFVLVILTMCAFFFITKVMKKTTLIEGLTQYAAIAAVLMFIVFLFAPAFMGVVIVSAAVVWAALLTALQIYVVYKLVEVVVLTALKKFQSK